MKKLLSVLATLGLTATAGATVIACGDKNPEAIKDLSVDLTVKDLGEITAAAATPTSEEVLIGIVVKNANVQKAELVVGDITATGASITVKEGSTVYNKLANPIAVTFTVKIGTVLKDLSTDLTVTNLGEITAAAATPTSQEVLAGIVAKNANVQTAELVVGDITATGASITVNEGSTVYNKLANPIAVTFTVKIATVLKDLSTDLTVTNLGEITAAAATPTSQEVLDAIVAKNANVQTAELVVGDITATGASITVNEGSTVYNKLANPIAVTFTVKASNT
ncbi:lipoprotein [Williamsoniiplasma somnilux]|uniref:lipoprotein n=1 Tax=Williamsoniiplasma somnilux TaxID=215578 RepID=UPI000467C694|nr:lipoprotein [Williamsoniiplasma somnilux]